MGSPFDTTAWIARGQHGRVAWAQLVAEGVDRHTIQRWLVDGRLRRVHDGVYAVGHQAPSVHADFMAAVLACGAGAVLSHWSAAHLLGLIRRALGLPHVTVPTTAGRARPGIVVHRVRALDMLDVSTLDGIPLTTVPRTLLDLAPQLTTVRLTRACHEAWVRHGTTPRQIAACIARNPHKKGIAKLHHALAGDVTLSDLEDAFLALLGTHDLPRPRTNIDRAGDKVDCHWPALGLTIELLSYRFHATRQAFEQDVARRRRSNHIAYTYGDIVERGAATAAELRELLAAVARGRPAEVPTAAARGRPAEAPTAAAHGGPPDAPTAPARADRRTARAR